MMFSKGSHPWYSKTKTILHNKITKAAVQRTINHWCYCWSTKEQVFCLIWHLKILWDIRVWWLKPNSYTNSNIHENWFGIDIEKRKKKRKKELGLYNAKGGNGDLQTIIESNQSFTAKMSSNVNKRIVCKINFKLLLQQQYYCNN